MKVRLGDLTRIKTGKLDANASSPDGVYPFFTCSKEPLRIDSYSYDCECVLVAGNGDLNVKYYHGKFDAYQRTYIIESNGNGKLFMPYLYYFMDGYLDKLRKMSIGGVIKYIKLGNLTDALIELPDYETQKQVVRVLNKVEEVITARQQELQKLDNLVKARFIELFGGADYPNVLFENVCVFLRNGASIKQTKGAGGYPITRIETLSNDVFNTDRLGYADITDLEKYQSYVLHHGDILISHINSVAYLGRAVQYRGQLDTPIIHGMNLLCARIADSYNPTYIEWFFKTPMAKEYISTITKKAVNQASITTSDLKKMQVPNPPKGLQDQFATFVEQIDKSKVVVQKALNEAQTLFDSLMQEYFG